jgi:hypothetical protein
MSVSRSSVRGDALSHPVSVAAIAVLLINDHLLKATMPGWFTGKASDFAGLVFFPLLLVSLVEIARSALRDEATQRRSDLLACVSLTGIVFTLVKLDPTAGHWYSIVWGWLSAPIHGSVAPVALVQDRTDLWALLALVIAWWIGRARLERSVLRDRPTVDAEPSTAP